MKKNELQINDDIRHHLLFWKLKRTAWVFMVLVVITALAGFTGGGKTSERSIVGDSITVTYERITRKASIAAVKVNIEAVNEDTFELRFSGNYLRRMRMENISPLPLLHRSGETEDVLYFSKGSGSAPEVILYLKPIVIGNISFTVASGTKRVDIQQLILP